MKYFLSGLVLIFLSGFMIFPVGAKITHHSLYTVQTFEVFEDACKNENDCAHLRVEYPSLGSFLKADVRNKINQTIVNDLLGSKQTSLEAWGVVFLKDYDSFDKSNTGAPAWSHSSRAFIDFINDEILGLVIHSQGYMGGAHGYSHTEFRNYDLKTGQRVILSDLFKPGFEKALNQEAEKAFRAQKGLGRWESLEKAGYEFKQNKFAVNNNVLMTPKGLTFYFNDYEIAPYVMGPTQVSVNYAPLSNWIKGWGQKTSLISRIQEAE